MLIRPQQQRVRSQRALLASLHVGDEVVTVGGLLGRIVSLDDDEASIETAPGVVMRFRRAAVSGLVGEPRVEHEEDVAGGDDDGPA